MDVRRIHAQLLSLQDRVRPMFRSLGVSASGLSAHRQKIDAIVSNIANAETTRTPEGGPYRRRVVELEPQVGPPPGGLLEAGRIYPSGERAGELPLPGVSAGEGVNVLGVSEDTSDGPLVYDPGHPDADENGYVRMPNVSLTQEIVELMEARRLYEANATAFQAVKNMLQRAAQI
jgi:flagellar basal-body rod protein FlgC